MSETITFELFQLCHTAADPFRTPTFDLFLKLSQLSPSRVGLVAKQQGTTKQRKLVKLRDVPEITTTQKN